LLLSPLIRLAGRFIGFYFYHMDTLKGFKLLSLELTNNSLLGTINYRFYEDSDEQKEIYTTVLIGPNGTGKSNVLRIVIELFRELYVYQRTEKVQLSKVTGFFKLRYVIDGQVFTYTNNKQSVEFIGLVDQDNKLAKKISARYIYLGKKPLDDPSKLLLPMAIIANSIMVTDKFLFTDRENFKIYHYQGIRDRPQNASTASYVRRTVERVVDSRDSNAFIDGLKRVMENFSHSTHRPYVTYRTVNTGLLLDDELTPERLNQFFVDMDENYKRQGLRGPNKLYHYLDHVQQEPKLIERIFAFIRRMRSSGELNKVRRSHAKFLAYGLLEADGIDRLRKVTAILSYSGGLVF